MSNELAKWTPEAVFHLARTVQDGGGDVLPAHARKAGAALAIMQTGVELGLPPMTALRSIHMVKGRPVIGAEAQLALARRAGIRHRWVETTATSATIELTRPGEAPFTLTFSMDDAKNAGLTGNETYRKHPAAMLRARAIGAAVRAYCPDVVLGVWSPEEVEEVTATVVRDPLSAAEDREAAAVFVATHHEPGTVELPDGRVVSVEQVDAILTAHPERPMRYADVPERARARALAYVAAHLPAREPGEEAE